MNLIHKNIDALPHYLHLVSGKRSRWRPLDHIASFIKVAVMTGAEKQPVTFLPKYLATQMRTFGGKGNEFTTRIYDIQSLPFKIGEIDTFSGRDSANISHV
jgi:hypothetical protein